MNPSEASIHCLVESLSGAAGPSMSTGVAGLDGV